nr:MAG TPA: hypothetical protein [Caudoviricetes sp.]
MIGYMLIYTLCILTRVAFYSFYTIFLYCYRIFGLFERKYFYLIHSRY